MRKVIALVALTAVLSGCVYVPKGAFHSIKTGERVDANPTVLARFMIDRKICDGEASKAALSSQPGDAYVKSMNLNMVFDGCLAQRGYIRK